MGNFLSRFKSLESTKEKLESIQNEIEKIDDYKWVTLRNQNHIIGLYIFGLSVLYAIMITIVYFNYMQRFKNKGAMAFVLYAVTFPILAYFLRRLLKSYYQHNLSVQEDRMQELKRQKRKILDTIMEKETYKVAKELIEKYDPAMLKDRIAPDLLNQSAFLNQSKNDSILRQRFTPMQAPMNPALINQQRLMNQTPFNASFTAANKPKAIMDSSAVGLTPKPPQMSQQKSVVAHLPPQFNSTMPTPMQRRPNLIRPVCAQDRSIVEKFVDYLVSDGPNNRYALICKFCHSHNGMALKDEFDYLNFRCCFCHNFNPARKQKPIAPTLVSYENAFENQAKDSLAEETLDENLKKFKIEDEDDSGSISKNGSALEPQIEEIENKLNETKLMEKDDEMQVDERSAETTEELSRNLDDLVIESKQQLNQQLDGLKLTDAN